MNTTFNYLDNLDFAVTVCDCEGIVLYQNGQSLKRDGNAMGKNLYECHKAASGEIIRRLIETGSCNTYEVIKHGQKRLIHQTPWLTEDGQIGGLIETSILLPDDLRTFNRDQ